MKIAFKSDKYRSARGGYSRMLNVSCSHCGHHAFFYQKDGPGPLKRMYVDRILESLRKHPAKLLCSNCKYELGIYYVYPKEKRPAYRLFQDAVTKKIIKLR